MWLTTMIASGKARTSEMISGTWGQYGQASKLSLCFCRYAKPARNEESSRNPCGARGSGVFTSGPASRLPVMRIDDRKPRLDWIFTSQPQPFFP
jgi:hypothetical protein